MFSIRPSTRALTTLALAVLSLGAATAAVTVTDVRIGKQGPDLTIAYRLNQAATSVSIQVGAQSFTGPTAKGLNTATVPGSLAGQSATITATAPAVAGAGGAEVIIPFTQDATSNRMTGIDVVTRAGSPYYGRVFIAAGFLQAGNKNLFSYYGDGSLAAKKDLVASSGYSSGSFPFGMALIQGDSGDRMIVSNRSVTRLLVYNPDLSKSADLEGRYTYPGCAATPLQDSGGADVANGINTWLGGNLENSVIHDTFDLSTNTRTPVDNVAFSGTDAAALVQSIAIDPKNKVLYKASAATGATIDRGNVSKWTSSDYGFSWTEDTAWNSAFVAAIGATEAAGLSLGVARDKGFNADNLNASYVWVCVSGGTGATAFNKLYRVNAGSGAVDAAGTIDLRTVVVPADSTTVSDKPGHFLAVDDAGNIVLTVGNQTFQSANYWGALAPNTAGPTSHVSNVVLNPPAYVDLAITPATVGNTGTGVFTFTATAFDPKGIVADNVQVSVDLVPIGGGAVNLTRQSVSGDGLTGVYTGTYTVQAAAPLGGKDITATMTTSASGTPTVKATLSIYNAYAPAWSAAADGNVTTSPAVSDQAAWLGTDTGKVLCLNTATGAPVASFGSGGVASVSGPAIGRLLLSAGRLYVITPTGVDILNSGRGSKLGTINIAGAVDVAAHPGDYAAVYVTAGNFVYRVNAATGAQLAQSADLGALTNRIAIGPSVAGGGSWVLVVGTEGDGTGINGKIVMLNPDTLGEAYPAVTDPLGAVRSRAVFAEVSGSPVFGIGGASGLWGVDATTGALLPWTTGSFSTGNPYLTSAPIDADVTTTVTPDPAPRFIVATRGSATAGGQILVITASNGERVSFGGYPAQLTTAGSGFAAGAGVLAIYGSSIADGATLTRPVYVGADAVAKQFFGLETLPDATNYNASPDKKHIYDPNDTGTFPGATPGAFTSVPALAGDKIVIGSAAGSGKAYGFPSLTVITSGWVTNVTPANGADGVSGSTNVTLTFSKDISTFTVDNTTVKLLDQSGAEVPATITVQGASTVVIDPNSSLATNQYYSAVVLGVPDQLQPFSSIFYTGSLVVAGDVNKDGQFNSDDVKDALRVAGGLLNATAIDKAQADTNGDGKVTVTDADVLQRRLNGK